MLHACFSRSYPCAAGMTRSPCKNRVEELPKCPSQVFSVDSVDIRIKLLEKGLVSKRHPLCSYQINFRFLPEFPELRRYFGPKRVVANRSYKWKQRLLWISALTTTTIRPKLWVHFRRAWRIWTSPYFARPRVEAVRFRCWLFETKFAPLLPRACRSA